MGPPGEQSDDAWVRPCDVPWRGVWPRECTGILVHVQLSALSPIRTRHPAPTPRPAHQPRRCAAPLPPSRPRRPRCLCPSLQRPCRGERRRHVVPPGPPFFQTSFQPAARRGVRWRRPSCRPESWDAGASFRKRPGCLPAAWHGEAHEAGHSVRPEPAAFHGVPALPPRRAPSPESGPHSEWCSGDAQ